MLDRIFKITGWLASIYLLLATTGSCTKDPDVVIEADSSQVIVVNKPNSGKIYFEILDKNIIYGSEQAIIKDILVTVKKSTGEIIMNMAPITLRRTDTSYITDGINLKFGQYSVTRTFCTDPNGNIILASPVKGSEEAKKVSKPLEFSFSINLSDTTETIQPEILGIKDKTPADFGINDAFTIIQTVPISLVITAYNAATRKYELVDAEIQISDPETNYSFFMDISAKTQTVFIKEDMQQTIIEVFKPGYKTQKISLSYSELLKYINKPLIIVMEVA